MGLGPSLHWFEHPRRRFNIPHPVAKEPTHGVHKMAEEVENAGPVVPNREAAPVQNHACKDSLES
jgi:hypothetical protein